MTSALLFHLKWLRQSQWRQDMDLRIIHERFGCNSNQQLNGTLHYRAACNIDTKLNEGAAGKIRHYLPC